MRTIRQEFEGSLDDAVNTALTERKFKPTAFATLARQFVDSGLNGTQQSEQYFANLTDVLQQIEYLKMFPDVFGNNGQIDSMDRLYVKLDKEKARIAAKLGYRDSSSENVKSAPEAKRDVHKACYGQMGTVDMYQ